MIRTTSPDQSHLFGIKGGHPFVYLGEIDDVFQFPQNVVLRYDRFHVDHLKKTGLDV